jgi:putative transcriptional regulator
MPTSLQGHLLVASPDLQDPNFLRTVVLLVQHNDEGALGLVLNRTTSMLVKDVWAQVGIAPCAREDHLFVGGPVNGPLMAVHPFENIGEMAVIPGVFFCSARPQLEQLVGQDGPMKFFAGFSGWGPGQLESEIAEGAWLTLPAEARHIFGQDEELWQRATNEIASASVYGVLKIKHVPQYPWLN